jgi:hypothetical protein
MTGRPLLFLPALLLCCWLGMLAAPAAQAADHIWSGIVLASQAEKPKPPPAELAHLAPEIGKTFGCNQLQLLGSATRLADDPTEHWFVPTQHFSMTIKSKRAQEGSYELHIVFYHDKEKLAEADAHLAPNSPLIIRGPMHAKGQIVYALQVMH